MPLEQLYIEQELPDYGFEPDIDYLELLLESRAADIREGILFRQGKGAFCLPSAGHENMAAIAYALLPADYIYCHYRDRALMLARGTPLYDIALGFFAKRDSSSAGRQLASHFSDAPRNIVSCASPIALQCLPAAGSAWAMKLQGKKSIVVCCMGEAGLREGEFYEAWCFAVQENLPVIFVVEDNGYGISTPTEKMNPLGMGIFEGVRLKKIDGRIASQVYQAMLESADMARDGAGPTLLWISFDRLMSHTSSDDQKAYRAPEELQKCVDRDPITLLRDDLFDKGSLDAVIWQRLEQEAQIRVANIYAKAEQAPEPDIQALLEDVRSKKSFAPVASDFVDSLPDFPMAKAVNETLGHLLGTRSDVVLFGQDICDPKGGVFSLTKGLSSLYGGRVFNAPLAEATICGAAAGMALAGLLPIFELQFIDFMAPGFNQIANQIATMRWRTAGQYKCPLILLAPCGGYTHGGGPWHSQTNEGIFAHIPGLNIYMPSNALDAARLIISCSSREDPSLILLPKKQFFKNSIVPRIAGLRGDAAVVLKEGVDATIVSWGNCVELALQAEQILLADDIRAEVIDLKAIAPCDTATIIRSLEKTGRLIVVHEDNRTCGFGQSLIAEIVVNAVSWNTLCTPPQLVCRDDTLLPFNDELASSLLPSVDKIIYAVKIAMS